MTHDDLVEIKECIRARRDWFKPDTETYLRLNHILVELDVLFPLTAAIERGWKIDC